MSESEFKADAVESAGGDPSGGNIVHVAFNGGVKGRITFLEENIFRYDVDPKGEFAAYAKPVEEKHAARIQQRPDGSDAYTKPSAAVREQKDRIVILCKDTSIIFEKATAKMQIWMKGRILMEEAESLEIKTDSAVQTLIRHKGEDFYGGGTQNGRFLHTGRKIQIVNESGWMDGGVASPNPFYLTTAGYGVLRNTFAGGSYDFGAKLAGRMNPENLCDPEKIVENAVVTMHKENKFSAYFFLSCAEDKRHTVQELLRGYYHVTGNPMLLPEYGFYEGHLNCYNRDAWSEESGGKAWIVKGSDSHTSQGRTRYESGMATGYRLTENLHSESLNGERPYIATENYPETVDAPYEFSARASSE